MAERDAAMARMVLQGKTLREIGETFGVTYQTVSERLRLYKEQWREVALRDVSVAKGKILEELRLVRAEAWESWLQSRGKQVATQTEDSSSDQGGRSSRTTVREKVTHGDSSYLSAILVSIGQESKLLGLNEPERIALTNREALRHEGEKLAEYTTQQLLELYRRDDAVPVGGTGEA